MSAKKGTKHLNRVEYKDIRLLLDNGLSISAVCRMSGRSYPTVVNVKNSSSFQDYKDNRFKKEPVSSYSVLSIDEKIPVIEGYLDRVCDEINKLGARLDKLENRTIAAKRVPINAQI